MRFDIKAVHPADGIVRTVLDAASEADARRLAENQGLRVLSLQTRRTWPVWRRAGASGGFPLVLFSQELCTLLNAGLSLVDAIESLSEKESDLGTRKVLAEVTRLLYEGKSFSLALGQFPGIFPELYVALIQSSEKTGALADALNRYVTYRTRVDLVRQKVIGASIYPALLLTVGCAVLLFLLGYVVPRFSLVFTDTGRDLPWLSRALMTVGKGIHDHQGLVFAALALAIAGAWLALRMPATRARLERAVERLPGIRNRLALYQLSRLYRSLGILLQGGIPIATALGMARGLLSAGMRPQLDTVTARIREGQPLSRALEDNGLATPVAMRMLRAGEQAGNLGLMMERTADFYDEETNRWIEWFVRLFEPLLMVLVGGMIGIVVILMYIPIFELASSIQ